MDMSVWGTVWHTLLLSKCNPAFAWLPVETIIHGRQQEYYAAIKALLIEAISTSDEMSYGKRDKTTLCWNKTQEYLKTYDYIMNADVRELHGVSAATANQILSGLVEDGKLTKYYEGRHWAYHLIDEYITQVQL